MQPKLELLAATIESPPEAATWRIRGALEAAGALITEERLAFETAEGAIFSFELEAGLGRLEKLLDWDGVFLNRASRGALAEAVKRGERVAGVLTVRVQDPYS
jgi:hypothetical protein